MSILSISLALFLITNPIGNTPAILAMLRGIPVPRQRLILARESLLAAALALVFLFVGEGFLSALGIRGYTVSICGGILLILVALQMIFPHHKIESSNRQTKHPEPFLVPIATPLLCGGGLFAAILLYAHQEGQAYRVAIALLMSFSCVLPIMFLAPSLNRILGPRGLYALEQLMGMVLAMLAIEMLVKGARLFIEALA